MEWSKCWRSSSFVNTITLSAGARPRLSTPLHTKKEVPGYREMVHSANASQRKTNNKQYMNACI